MVKEKAFSKCLIGKLIIPFEELNIHPLFAKSNAPTRSFKCRRLVID